VAAVFDPDPRTLDLPHGDGLDPVAHGFGGDSGVDAGERRADPRDSNQWLVSPAVRGIPMNKKTGSNSGKLFSLAAFSAALTLASWGVARAQESQIGQEKAVPVHLQDGQEFELSLRKLIAYGEKLFTARFTIQDGLGRPLTKGTGAPLADPSSPLVFPRNFNRISSPDSQGCSACHNLPRPGGGGDRVTDVFVLGQRFDFLTFDPADLLSTRGAVDEAGHPVLFERPDGTNGSIPAGMSVVSNERKTVGMFGSGYIEMLARQITANLQAIRNSIPPGGSAALVSKGISFGVLRRNPDGTWDTSGVQGISALSLASSDSSHPPSLIIRPFAQASNVISLRQFSNNAYNHHHGIQTEERFGLNVDADGDGIANELTTADMTAVTVFQATLPPPGQVIPNDPALERAVLAGQRLFSQIGCGSCHIPALPLIANNNPGLPGEPGWMYFEPNPYNPPGNLQLGTTNYPDTAPALVVDLTSNQLPGPRLKARNGVVWVPAFMDFKLHDITSGPNDPDAEPLDQNQTAGSAAFFAGNRALLTRHLWGLYNSGPFMHHGKFSTMREAIEHHNGEALSSRQAFDALAPEQRDAVLEFLKTLQVLPPDATSLVVDENGRPTQRPPANAGSP
jgi:Di-haem oxidoreductase, putative peroxidase